MNIIKYPPKILLAFGETISGNDEIMMWLFKNGYPELAALSRSIRGSQEAFAFLLKHHPRLAALDGAIDEDIKALAWLKKYDFQFELIFAGACQGKPEARDWLMKKKLEIFIRLADKIRYYRENQYHDYHKKQF